ncbi:MAG: 4Fe-4S binding protein [Chloroflexota bacterium]
MTAWLVVDTEKCTGCGVCLSVCECGAIQLDGGVAVVVKDCSDEEWCTICEEACPYGAISCPFEIVIEEG